MLWKERLFNDVMSFYWKKLTMFSSAYEISINIGSIIQFKSIQKIGSECKPKIIVIFPQMHTICWQLVCGDHHPWGLFGTFSNECKFRCMQFRKFTLPKIKKTLKLAPSATTENINQVYHIISNNCFSKYPADFSTPKY